MSRFYCSGMIIYIVISSYRQVTLHLSVQICLTVIWVTASCLLLFKGQSDSVPGQGHPQLCLMTNTAHADVLIGTCRVWKTRGGSG